MKKSIQLLVSYDSEADACYIYMQDNEKGEVATTYTLEEDSGLAYDINVDVTNSGEVLGIEILDAKKKLPKGFLDQFKGGTSSK